MGNIFVSKEFWEWKNEAQAKTQARTGTSESGKEEPQKPTVTIREPEEKQGEEPVEKKEEEKESEKQQEYEKQEVPKEQENKSGQNEYPMRERKDEEDLEKVVDVAQEIEATASAPKYELDTSMLGTVVEESGGDLRDDESQLTGAIGKTRSDKKSFDELVGANKSVPRLNKTLILAILIGSAFGLFAITKIAASMQAQKREKARRQMSVDTSDVRLNLGRPVTQDDSAYTEEEIVLNEAGELVKQSDVDNRVIYRAPPAYDPLPTDQQVRTTATQPRGVPIIEQQRLSQSDIEAMKAPLEKSVSGYGRDSAESVSGGGGAGGFGDSGAMRPVSAFSSASDELRDYLEDQIGRYASAASAIPAQFSGQNTPDTRDETRHSTAGAYKQVNTESGNVKMLGDTQLFPGTIIHAVLVTGINTSYPADITARTIENIYDSATGKNLLIPQGSILKGSYSSSSFGVNRVQIAWTELIVNHRGVSYSVSLGGMAGVDRSGRAAIKGTLDDHYFEWLKAAGIVSLFTILNSEIAYQTKATQNTNLGNLIDQNQAIVNQLGNKLIERATDITPTVTVPNGTVVSVSVNVPISLVPFERFYAETHYVRYE
jgi:type IV secretory pathway VirB10-like protein